LSKTVIFQVRTEFSSKTFCKTAELAKGTTESQSSRCWPKHRKVGRLWKWNLKGADVAFLKVPEPDFHGWT